ncbi:MAG: radical SAM protein [Candidatus Omnitrophota bacterium]
MKLSRFNLWVEDYPKKGEHLLFNTRTQALIKANNSFKDELKALSGKEFEKNQSILKENGIIIEDIAQEDEKINDFFKQLKYESQGLSLEVTLLTTYSCNFRCVYCFEESVRESTFLDKRTSDLIVKWLINRALKRNIKKIHIVYYGGEPLLNTRPIHDISWQMNKWAKENNVEFFFSMITNGSLLNADAADKLLTVGFKGARITLDGDKDMHNKKRPFTDGGPTFGIIIDNIKSIIDKIDVEIVGNFDRENFASIFKLLDYLEKEGLLHKFKRVLFSPIVPRLGPKKNPGAIELTECLSFIEKDGLFDETVRIKRELMRRGIKPDTGLAINACPLIMEDGGITIDPRGIIYKCNSLLGYPEFSIGNAAEEGLNENFKRFFNINAWEACPKECPYVPMCQGGCRFFSFLENKNFESLSCKKEYFDRIVPELIKLEYDKTQIWGT